MGTLIGHVAPGFGFLLIGLWHLYNHTKLYLLNGRNYKSLPWFPCKPPLLRHVELHLIILGASISVAMELFIAPKRHTPFSPDGSIPSNHLHNFEHSSISLLFLVYSASALSLDTLLPHRRRHVIAAGDLLLQLTAASAFSLQLLLFRLHSTDHSSVEGQYHFLLQLVIATSLATTLLGVFATSPPLSFVVSYARSLSVAFQGAWLVVMGVMLWTPRAIANGCFMNPEEGHFVVRCDDEESLHRAKSLVNIEFSWFFIGLVLFAVSFYLGMVRVYGDADVECYVEVDQDDVDVEAMRFKRLEKNGGAVIDNMER